VIAGWSQARTRTTGAPVAMFALAILVTAVVLLPPGYLMMRAAGERGGISDVLTANSTLDALWRTIFLTATVTATCALIGVPLAWLTTRTDLPFRSAWTVLLALPLAIPSFVGGFVMVSALGPGGLVQDMLEPFGVDRLPSVYGFRGAWFVISILSYPYIFLQVRAALHRVDPALEDAARSLGKGGWHAFVRVSLPQLRPAVAAGALLVALYTLSEFGAVSMLRYDTLTPLIYIRYTTSFDRGTAAVLGLPLIALAAAIVTMDGMTRGRARYYARAQMRPPRTVRLGVWRWPAFALCSLVTALGVGLPVAVIVYWLVKGLALEGTTDLLTEAIVNSARASALAAVVAAAAALPLALLSARHPSWLTGILEKASYSGQALPAITIALALVFFSAHYMTPLYQTIWLLVFAYAVRFLPEAYGAIRSGLLQINPNTEEAARGLGAGPLKTFTRVTVPQTLPGVSAGMLLVFLTAIKELPITVLLAPIGFDTLATQIWSSTSEAFFARAALPSLILVAMSAVAVIVMMQREKASMS